jgi:hypothetical protein
MLMGGDSKKLASIIVARAKPSAEKNAEAYNERAKEPYAEDEAHVSCAEEILTAVEAKDAKRLAQAIADFLEIHEEHESGETAAEEKAEHESRTERY